MTKYARVVFEVRMENGMSETDALNVIISDMNLWLQDYPIKLRSAHNMIYHGTNVSQIYEKDE